MIRSLTLAHAVTSASPAVTARAGAVLDDSLADARSWPSPPRMRRQDCAKDSSCRSDDARRSLPGKDRMNRHSLAASVHSVHPLRSAGVGQALGVHEELFIDGSIDPWCALHQFRTRCANPKGPRVRGGGSACRAPNRRGRRRGPSASRGSGRRRACREPRCRTWSQLTRRAGRPRRARIGAARST